MVLQDYLVEISNEHIILGNDAIFQCSIPSFVSDFISIQAWVDNEATAVEVNEVKGKFWKFLPLDSFNSRSVLISGMCMCMCMYVRMCCRSIYQKLVVCKTAKCTERRTPPQESVTVTITAACSSPHASFQSGEKLSSRCSATPCSD